MEVTNRFKELDLVDRVPEELWMEVPNIVQKVMTKTIPKKKKNLSLYISPALAGRFFSTAAAAAKSTLCDPMDGSPPGSPVPGILQARTLKWVAISFSNA